MATKATDKVSSKSSVLESSVFSFAGFKKKLHKSAPHLGNIHAVPTVEKVVLNTCCKQFLSDARKMDQIKEQLTAIAGQAVVPTYARKSVAAFKTREGMQLGFKVTLRKRQAEAFLFRLIYLNFPRFQDFRGYTNKAFDGNGNYTLGIKDITPFMESDHDKETKFGFDITIVTTAKTDSDALSLMKEMNFPFKEVTTS